LIKIRNAAIHLKCFIRAAGKVIKIAQQSFEQKSSSSEVFEMVNE